MGCSGIMRNISASREVKWRREGGEGAEICKAKKSKGIINEGLRKGMYNHQLIHQYWIRSHQLRQPRSGVADWGEVMEQALAVEMLEKTACEGEEDQNCLKCWWNVTVFIHHLDCKNWVVSELYKSMQFYWGGVEQGDWGVIRESHTAWG